VPFFDGSIDRRNESARNAVIRCRTKPIVAPRSAFTFNQDKWGQLFPLGLFSGATKTPADGTRIHSRR
jgi:hypothetical protein